MSLDLILTIIIILFACLGLFRGFIAEFFSIFGFLIALILSKYFTPLVINFAHVDTTHTNFVVVLYCIVFIVIYCILALIEKFLRVIIKVVLLGWLDRVLGGVFGLFKGLLIVLLIVLVLMAMATSNNSCQKLVENSFYVKGVLPRLVIVTNFLPKSLAQDVDKYRNEILLNGFVDGLENMYQNIMTPENQGD